MINAVDGQQMKMKMNVARHPSMESNVRDSASVVGQLHLETVVSLTSIKTGSNFSFVLNKQEEFTQNKCYLNQSLVMEKSFIHPLPLL